MISETVSEKPKRGRPAKYSRLDYRYTKGCTHAYTARGKQNVINRLYGIGTIQDAIEDGENALRWLMDSEGIAAGKPKSMRCAILSELGRIEDAKAMLSIARQIVELKPRTHDAVAMIRGTRIALKEVSR